MKRFTVLFSAVLILGWSGAIWANSAPVVSNVNANQRGDDSKLVDISYDLEDFAGLAQYWLSGQPEFDFDASGNVDFIDLSEVVYQWLWQAGWYSE